MASFVESATLKVIDQSSKPISKINAELKKLFATANSLKKINIDISGLGKASAATHKLTADLNKLRTSRVNLTVNTAGLSAASRQIARLQAQARQPIGLTTRASASGGSVLAGRAPGVHIIGGAVHLAGQSMVALAGHLTRAVREGTSQTDIGDFALDSLQLSKDEKAAATKAINELVKNQNLLNRGMISQTLAETLPTAGYNTKAAAWLAKQQLDFIAMETARGRGLDQARENSVKYTKALELAGLLTDEFGKFDEASAKKYINAFKQIAPSLGKEFNPESVFQFFKYARQARYSLTPEAVQAGLLTSEELGASSAGVALNQAVRQLLGQNVPPGTLANLKKLGLVTTQEVTEGTTGKKRRTKTVAGEPLDEPGLRLNLWKFARDTLIPKMRAQGLDPNKPMDVAKFVNPITSTQTAKDIVIAAINRSLEIQREVERAQARDPDKASQLTGDSIRNATIGLGAQLQGALGEGVTAFEPVLIPALKGVGDYFRDLGVDIRKASTGDKEAQVRLEGTAATAMTTGAMAMMARGPIAQAISAISSPLGIAAGMAGTVDPAASPTAKSLALAGVGLNAAAQGLQAAAAAQMVAAGAGGVISKLLPWIGKGTMALALGASAGSAGPGSNGYEYNNMSPEARKLARDLTVPQTALIDLAQESKKAADKLAAAKKVAAEYPTLQGPREDVLAAEQSLADVQKRITAAKAEELRISEQLAEMQGKDPYMKNFWRWLEDVNKLPPMPKPETTRTAIEDFNNRLLKPLVQASRSPNFVQPTKNPYSKRKYDLVEPPRDIQLPQGDPRKAVPPASASIDLLRSSNESFANSVTLLGQSSDKFSLGMTSSATTFQSVFNTAPGQLSQAGTAAIDAMVGGAPSVGGAIATAFIAQASGLKIGVDVPSSIKVEGKPSNTGSLKAD